MAKSNKAKAALPYARRMLEDPYVQEQLRAAATGLRQAYDRARKQRAQATEDKHLYRNLRQVATSIRRAATAIQRPTPEPRRRIGRKLAVFALAAGGCAWVTMKLQKREPAATQTTDSAAAATAAATATAPTAGGASGSTTASAQTAATPPPVT